ncbi:hypothetical protein F2Q70_00013628 [Brassica cretica]|uniref:Uncharacterized protein n=1 Tax=Brassica cretica TaxID=69181 RepID=A0A8S9LR04_BRACR|nr:hypothetical protein F2Q70_00013628 [Brassica cretica]
MDGKETETGGQFKADDSPAGYMLLSCSVQLGDSDEEEEEEEKEGEEKEGEEEGGRKKRSK